MKTKREIYIDIDTPEVKSGIVYAPFNEALESLTANGYEVISLPENARLRIQQGNDSYISRNGNWTREGVIYIPKTGNRLVRNSPILYSAKNATQAHREGKELYPTKEQVEQALADSISFPVKDIEIPTNRFDSEQFTAFAFGGEDEARAYGEFLRDSGIDKMPVHSVDKDYVNKQDKPFARQMWFRGFDDRSVLYGDDRGLHGVDRLRGVKIGAEGTCVLKKSKYTKALTDEDLTKILYPNTYSLRFQLEIAILNEDYRQAANLRDRINSTDEPF